MYTGYFGMTGKPFRKEIPVKEAYKSRGLVEMLTRLEYQKKAKGIALVIGESGVGKSMGIRVFREGLNENLFKFVYIPLSTVTVSDFYRSIAYSLGMIPKNRKVDLFRQIQEAILTLYNSKKITPIIVLDEFHLISSSIIQDLIMLLNFEMDSKDPYILILSAQPLVRHKLSLNFCEPFSQRITMRIVLKPLALEEVKEYISKRLKYVGVRTPLFKNNAVKAIHDNSQGSIRNINKICDMSLLLAYGEEKRTIDEEIVYKAASEVL